MWVGSIAAIVLASGRACVWTGQWHKSSASWSGARPHTWRCVTARHTWIAEGECRKVTALHESFERWVGPCCNTAKTRVCAEEMMLVVCVHEVTSTPN